MTDIRTNLRSRTLAACPFCRDGGDPDLLVLDATRHGGEILGYVECRKCLAQGPSFLRHTGKAAGLKARRAWNAARERRGDS